jgi:hypothetical protein
MISMPDELAQEPNSTIGKKQTTTSRIKPLAWAGISGSAVMIVFGVIALVSPPQIGNRVVNPVLFQIKNILEILAFAGWALICFVFYQTGAPGSGWLAKIALALAVLGAITASAINIANAIAIQFVNTPDWTSILLFGQALVAPVLLGIGALRVRMVSLWQALYPIIIVGSVPIALWVIFGDASPSFPAIVQAFAWIGFALLAMAVKPRT